MKPIIANTRDNVTQIIKYLMALKTTGRPYATRHELINMPSHNYVWLTKSKADTALKYLIENNMVKKMKEGNTNFYRWVNESEFLFDNEDAERTNWNRRYFHVPSPEWLEANVKNILPAAVLANYEHRAGAETETETEPAEANPLAVAMESGDWGYITDLIASEDVQ